MLPTPLPMVHVAHVDGRRGYSLDRSRDSADLGVEVERMRPSYSAAIVQEWTFDWLPNRVFPSLDDLRAAVSPLTDADIAAEKARWPRLGRVIDISGEDWPNKCVRHRRRPGLVQAYVDVCWIPSKGLIASLCAECRGAATGNGQGVVDIMEERRRHVAAMKPPLQMLMEGKSP